MADDGSRTDRVRDIGLRLHGLILRGIAAFVVLVMFAGLAYLVFLDRLDGGSLLLYAGVILGYIIHATKKTGLTARSRVNMTHG